MYISTTIDDRLLGKLYIQHWEKVQHSKHPHAKGDSEVIMEIHIYYSVVISIIMLIYLITIRY